MEDNLNCFQNKDNLHCHEVGIKQEKCITKELKFYSNKDGNDVNFTLKFTSSIGISLFKRKRDAEENDTLVARQLCSKHKVENKCSMY